MQAHVPLLAALLLAAGGSVFAAQDRIKVVYVGGNRFAPYQYTDDDGEPRGFVVELLRALAREADLDIEIRLGSWQDTTRQLDTGKGDLTAVALSASRSTRYIHVVPVWHLRQVALFRGRRDRVPSKLDEFTRETVAVTTPSALHEDLIALPPRTRPMIIPVRGAREALAALQANTATVAVGNALALDSHLADMEIADLQEVELRSVPYSLVIRRGREDLVPVLVAAYTRLHESGELSAIVERTLLQSAPHSGFERWGLYLLGLAGVGGAALLAVTGWNRALRLQVEARTSEFQAVVQRLEFHGLVQAQVSDGIIVLNGAHQITMWNAGAEALFDIPAAEALGTPSKRLVRALGADTDLDAIRREVQTNGLWRGEVTIRRGDESEVRVEATVKVLRDADGTPDGRIIVVHDIDARKRAEEELRAALSLHRATLESTNDGILAFDEEGNVTSYNQRLLEMWSLTPDALRSAADLRAAVEPQIANFGEVLAGWNRLRESQTSHVAIVRLKDGRLFERHTHPQRMGGAIVGRVFSYRDVTDRVRAEEEGRKLEAQIQHVQKLESLGVLAGGIAHDFNNLLVGMLGHAGLALMDLPPESPARHRIEQIETCAVRAAELTNQMLAYSGKGRFVVQPTDLTAIVREMSNLLQTAISKGARLELDLATDLPAVSADVAQLRQVVMNLITNASDAIGEKSGTIAVTTGVMHASREFLAESFVASAAEAGDYVFIEVRDTGCGMDAETRHRIFEPFFTTKVTGRGLGLAAVLGIVRGHQGAVRIDSTPGTGTTFRVLFPSTGSRVSAAVPKAVRTSASKKARVLVVDDEASVRMIARESLSRAGFVVVVAGDGQEAIDLMRAEGSTIDVVLLDMTMPGLNGIETLHEIHGIVRDLPVVLTSGYSEQDAAERCKDEVMSGFIQKPFAPTALVAKMNDVLAVGGRK